MRPKLYKGHDCDATDPSYAYGFGLGKKDTLVEFRERSCF